MPNPKHSVDIIVIGGGIGGLSAAIYLAAAGARVKLYEQNERVGGKMNVWEADGFRFDTGPHVLTMLFALEDLFRTARTTFAREMELIRLDPICRYHFPGGGTIDVPAEIADARHIVERIAPQDRESFDRFLEYAQRVYDQTTPTFLCQDFADHVSPAKLPKQVRDFLALRPFETLDRLVARHFQNPKLRQIFNLYALYSGSDPARCSALLSVIAHVQWNLGTYYPKGGLYEVARRLEQCARRMGVEIVTQAQVDEIVVHGNRARGVSARHRGEVDTERVYANAVVCNRDALSAGDLLPGRSRHREKQWEPTPSAFLMLLGVDGVFPALAHHNSFLTADERGEYASLWDGSGLPHPDPTIGVACQSVTDPDCAPPGCSNLFVMTNVPAVARDGFVWTPEFVQSYRAGILQKLECSGLPGLSQRILVEKIWIPDTFAARYGAWRGALYGPSGNGLRQMFTRPAVADPYVRGLFYAGGSTHPGGGVPLCILSGKIAAEKTIRYAERWISY